MRYILAAFIAFAVAALAPAVAGAQGDTVVLPPPVPLHAPYDPNNPFARIIRGELAAQKVYEDRDVLAFMDYAPIQPGHVLVISKVSQARNLLEEDPKDYARLMAVVRRIAEAQIAALGAQGFTIIENNGAGSSVPHLHIHVIPRMTQEPIMLGPRKRADPADLEAMAAKLRAAMKE